MADEPVSALDVSVRAQVLNLISDLIEQFDLTLVFVSHDLAVVRHLCERVAVVHDGNVVELGKAVEGAVSKIQSELPYGVELERVADQPTTVKEAA